MGTETQVSENPLVIIVWKSGKSGLVKARGQVSEIQSFLTEELEEMRSKLRAFLRENWSQRRPGCITATIYTIEGDPTTTTFYVEPDKNGTWRVATEYESECCWFYGMAGKERKRETGEVFYNVVERVVGGRDDKAKEFRIVWSVIPEGEKRQPNTYALRLRKVTRDHEGSPKEVTFIL